MLGIEVVGKGKCQLVEIITRIEALTTIERQTCQRTAMDLIGDRILATRIIDEIELFARHRGAHIFGILAVDQFRTAGGIAKKYCNFSGFVLCDGHTDQV